MLIALSPCTYVPLYVDRLCFYVPLSLASQYMYIRIYMAAARTSGGSKNQASYGPAMWSIVLLLQSATTGFGWTIYIAL